MRISPLLSTTKTGNASWEWVPSDFPSFLQELKHISSHCKEMDHLALYRGHRERDWILDSTFVRYVKEHILGIEPTSIVRRDYRHSISYQRLMGELFLFKFGTSTGPYKDLIDLAKIENLDPWFEYMKRIQQYPKEDLGTLQGSFLIDWSQRAEVAVFFANYKRVNGSEGAVWVSDISASGAALHQDTQVSEILKLLEDAILIDKPIGIPLVFCPRRQIACERARNQDAIYIAQMDLRFDLAEIWKSLESKNEGSEDVVLKLILPKGTERETADWLESKGVNEAFIFPDLDDKCPNKANAADAKKRAAD